MRRGELGPASNIKMLSEAMKLADVHLIQAWEHVGLPLERWLGPLSRATCNGLIDAAFLKLTVADDMIENQSHRVDIEDRTRSNATTNLCGQLRRFASIKALADMNEIVASSPSATQAIRSAEHALKSVKRTNGSGTVEAAMRGLMTATNKVSAAHEAVSSEVQLGKRDEALRAYQAMVLTTAEAHLDRISEQLSVLASEHSTECSALVNVARKFCLKASSSLQAKVLPTSLARCVKKAVRAVDDAALAVDQEHTRLDELRRLRLQSEQVEHTREVMAEEHHLKQRAAQRRRTQQLLDQLQAAEAKLDQLTEFVDFERQIEEVRKLVQNVKSFTELRGICAAEAVVASVINRVKQLESAIHNQIGPAIYYQPNPMHMKFTPPLPAEVTQVCCMNPWPQAQKKDAPTRATNSSRRLNPNHRRY